MYRIAVSTDTYILNRKQQQQNPYINTNQKIDSVLVKEQHNKLMALLNNKLYFSIKSEEAIPDMVFMSNAGLSLPRLPEQIVILPFMKYASRRQEHKFKEDIFKELNIKTVAFPGSTKAPFEGAAEAKWFLNGELLIVGYGYRMTQESVSILKSLLKKIYESYDVTPPLVLALNLQSKFLFHLNLAMMEISETECIIHKSAFDLLDQKQLTKYLEKIHVIESEDPFCLNSIIEGELLITHELNDPLLKKYLEKITNKTVVEIDTSEFEISGGSVRSLIFDLIDPRTIKRRQRAPSSPK